MQPGVIYESDRQFQVWEWSVGHSWLHLRSNPSASVSTRIEISFKPAVLVCLAASLDGVVITSEPRDALPAALCNALHAPLGSADAVYSVRSGTALGWVVAGSAAGREDDEPYDAPLLFDGWAARPGVRELFSTSP